MKLFRKTAVSVFGLLILLIAALSVFGAADEPVKSAYDEVNVPGTGITVLADTPDFYAEVTSVQMNEDNNAYEAEIYFCNRSSLPLDVRSDYAAVNGYVMDSYMFDVIPPHQRGYIYLEVMDEDLEQSGIESVDWLVFRFHVQTDAVDNYTELFSSDISLYPTGLKPEEVTVKAIKDFPKENYPFAQLIYSNEFIDFRVLDAKPTENGYFYEITAVAENLCGRDIILSGANFVVDGVETEPYWYCRIPAGLKAVTDIWIDAESLAEAGVTEFDTVSFSLSLYESMNYDEVTYSVPFFAYPLSFNPAKG